MTEPEDIDDPTEELETTDPPEDYNEDDEHPKEDEIEEIIRNL